MILKAIKILFAFITVFILILLGIGYKSDLTLVELKDKYTNSESKFISIDGMQVHYRDEGIVDDSVPVVLIHGTSSSLHTWDSCATDLIKTNRVIRFDLPAFGLTGPNAENDYSIERYVKFVDDVLNKLSIKQCYIVGNSLGGNIAWNYAAVHPQKVKKMILLDASGFLFNTKKSGTLAFKIGRNPYLKNMLTFFTPRFGVEKSVKDAYYNDSKVTDDLVQRYMDCTRREGNRKALIVRLNQPFVDNTEALKKITTPTLIIWGDNDVVVPIECAYKFQAYLPNNKLIILKDEGHVVMEENPWKVLPLIHEWLN